MKTYVFGHKKPDTDSVCSAISYAYLKNQMGMEAVPRVLGELNKETKFVLNYFNIEEPKYLDNVKVQIKNMSYLKDAFITDNTSIDDTVKKIHDLNVTGLPVVKQDGTLDGYTNLKDISKYIISDDIYKINTSYNNIINTLEASSLLKFDDEINGTILAAAYKSSTFIESVRLTTNHILIVGNRSEIVKYAIESCVKLIIIVGNNKISDELYDLAKQNKVNIIVTPFTTYLTANKIKLCNYISNVDVVKDPITFYTSDFRDDFLDIANKFGHTNYPVLDLDDKCVGMLRVIDQNNYLKCNVILVDHNQSIQSVDGLEEASILEVIDHHNLGTVGTSTPISFRAMPVGCTSTIIYRIYMENHIDIPKNIAGIMLSAILSDTLILKSPTTTQLDIDVANELAKIAGVDIESYGYEMFKAGSSINDMSCEDVFNQDFKTFKLDNINLGISQVMTLDIDSIMNQKDTYIDILNDTSDKLGYKVNLMFVTDIIKNGSYIFYNENAKDIVEIVYGIKDLYEGYYIDGMVSRKKQMVPDLMEYFTR